VPEQSFWFRIAVSGGGGAAELYLGKTPNPYVFKSETLCRRKKGSRRCARRPHHPLAWPGLAHATRWCGPLVALLRLVFWLRESSGKIGVLRYFLEIFLKVGFLHKNETPEKLCWKQR
jgi:hypothetical protein